MPTQARRPLGEKTGLRKDKITRRSYRNPVWDSPMGKGRKGKGSEGMRKDSEMQKRREKKCFRTTTFLQDQNIVRQGTPPNSSGDYLGRKATCAVGGKQRPQLAVEQKKRKKGNEKGIDPITR